MSQQRSAEPSPFSPGYGQTPLVFGEPAEELAKLTAVLETL
ncbi:hypothetical protein [Mycetocola saprophilus]